MSVVGCGAQKDTNISGNVTGSVDVNVNDNQCEMAQFNGKYYIFNRSTLLGERIGISIDPTATYPDVPFPLSVADTFRVTPYTQEELDFIATNN